jgi:hypothetical protein
MKGAAICIVCNENTSALKYYSINRHGATKHASQLNGAQGQLRKGQNNLSSNPPSLRSEFIEKRSFYHKIRYCSAC